MLEALSLGKGFVLAHQLWAEGEVRCVTVLPNGSLAIGSMDNMVRLYSDVSQPPQLLVGHERRAGADGVLALAAGQLLASAGRDGRILLWEGAAGPKELRGHGDDLQGTNVHVVSCLARSSDGGLISGGWDKTVPWRTFKRFSVTIEL